MAEEVEAEIRQVEKELAEARRVGAKRRAEELSAVRDILYEDKWFRVATAVYVHLKRQFAEDGEAAEVIETARSRLFGLRLEVVEAPLLKIKAAVDREGKIAVVRCRATLDLGVEAVFTGVASGYRLEEAAQTSKTANETAGGWEKVAEKTATSAAENIKRRGAAGRGVESAGGGRRRREEEGARLERLLEEVRREFSGLPVYVGVEDGYVYVTRTAPMDQRQFRRYLETCRGLALGSTRGQAAGGAEDRLGLFSADLSS